MSEHPRGDVPAVSVVVPTRDRPRRLAQLLASLRAQVIPGGGSAEVIVVDDGSASATRELLAQEIARAGFLDLRVLTRPRSEGPSAARNAGWRAARGTLVAFTDDDCVADPHWLAAGMHAAGVRESAFVQGRTAPNPAELDRRGAFSRTLRIEGLGPYYQTCNIFYPRALLERLGGFDERAFSGRGGGEDTDLAWRAIELGAEPVLAPRALILHAVARLGPMGKLRIAARWTEAMRVYARHPELRSAALHRRVFWKGSHYLLVRALLAIVVPRRRHFLRRWLALPYARHLADRGRYEGGGLLAAPYFALHDLVELVAVTRGAMRYRVLVL